MSELAVYFARAIDARPVEDIVADDERYAELLRSIGAVIVNPFVRKSQRPIMDGLSVAERDLTDLKSSDIVLADLSLPDYQYVGCIFEIVHATSNDIPVILVIGEREFHKRVFFQAYSDFIARDAGEAIEYICRAYTQQGVEQQMSEMQAYYNEIAPRYADPSMRTHKRSQADIGPFLSERAELCEVIRNHVRGRVCQIGIGTGDWTKTICEVADEVVGVEISQEMLAQARFNLSSFNNIFFLHCDAIKEDITGGPFDCVVVYFLFSLIPRSMKDCLFARVRKITKPGGLLIVADTKKLGDISAMGLGRRQLQQRESGGKKYVLYKEHFVGDSLAKLLEKEGCTIIASSGKSTWFCWAVGLI